MLSPGDVLENRFEIESVIRRTEAFTLFRGNDREKKRAVLIREMPVTARERDKAVKQALAEAQARMKIKHALLPETYGAYAKEGYFYVVLEDVEGESLKALTSDGPPDEGQVMRWAGDVIRLLDHIKSRGGITVRDLRPANVVATDAGELKVMDLGLSRVLRGSATTGKKGSQPEIRALGGFLYELLTGIPAPELSDRPIAGELFRRVNLVNPDVSEEVADAVERMVDPLAEPFKSLDEVKLYLGLSGQPIPKREKKERKQSDRKFDPERLDPAEEKAAMKALLVLAVIVGLGLMGLIQYQNWRASKKDTSIIAEGPSIAQRKKNWKWTPERLALKDYLDDLGAFASYEARALNLHSVIRRKHQVQAATNAQFEKILDEKIIPNYQIFVDNMRAVNAPNPEIHEVHLKYVKGARLLLTGYREQRKALHSGNMHDLDDANRWIDQGSMYVGQWLTGIRDLERKYGLYDSDLPPPSPKPEG